MMCSSWRVFRFGRTHALVRWAWAVLMVLAAAAIGAAGCLNRPLCDTDCRPATTNVFVDTVEQRAVDKIDLLFMIDNSISMADKQEILAQAVPDLVGRLVNPFCVDRAGALAPDQPAGPTDRCASPYRREFDPVADIHIGVISSSLGDYGGDACPGENDSDKNAAEYNDDRAHLIGSRPRAVNASIAGVDPELGFLAWGPGGDLDGLKSSFSALVQVVGEQGCGYEASLEAWYRFLVDPAPPEDVRLSPCGSGGGQCATPVGIDQTLLDQRRAFLRADSLLAIVMLTDENDCSIQNTGQSFYAAQLGTTLWRASSPCATNPNDPCCYSCGIGPDPDKCPNPPDDCADPKLGGDRDDRNLRCFAEKRRFGIDFLYPTARYVNALERTQLCISRADLDASDPARCPDQDGDGAPDIAPNPLLQDLSGEGGIARDQSLIFLAGIIGVPWQDIATERTTGSMPGEPLDYMTASEITASGIWDVILGDATPPASDRNPYPRPVPPADPHMVESTSPRPGIAGPTAASLEDPVNGHEWRNNGQDDLQYACIFPLGDARDCTSPENVDRCDCGEKDKPAENQNPLCQVPGTTDYGTMQYYAKAYPGLRHLEVLEGFGDNSIVASICARNVRDRTAPDFGYRPAVGAIVDRLKDALLGRCLPRQLTVNDNDTPDNTLDDTVPCSVIEAIPQADAGCDSARRRDTVSDANVIQASFRRLELAEKCGTDVGRACDTSAWTLCEIGRATADLDGNGVLDCQDKDNPEDVGWCYVDPDHGIGDPALVAGCKATDRRLLRFVDPEKKTPTRGATALIACLGAELQDDPANTGAVNVAAKTASRDGGG